MVKKSVLVILAGLVLLVLPEPITSVVGLLVIAAGIALHFFG